MVDKNMEADYTVGTAVAAQLDAILDQAEMRCKGSGARLTSGRRKVLELLLRENRALGAYEILDLLRAEASRAVPPPVAYRALHFLIEHGLAHKVERLNAFIACAHPGEHHAAAFMICRICRNVAEAHLHPVTRSVDQAALSEGFQIERMMIEVEGLCPTCADAA